jgi:flavin-binding protein dodecin
VDTVGPQRAEGFRRHQAVRASQDRREEAVSVYRVIDVIGTSSDSWEDAAVTAVNTARQSLRDMRIAEVVAQDLQLGEAGEITYRTKLRISFKYEAAQ